MRERIAMDAKSSESTAMVGEPGGFWAPAFVAHALPHSEYWPDAPGVMKRRIGRSDANSLTSPGGDLPKPPRDNTEVTELIERIDGLIAGKRGMTGYAGAQMVAHELAGDADTLAVGVDDMDIDLFSLTVAEQTQLA